jgi:uncharacterized protein YpiB (UPF0302 family)
MLEYVLEEDVVERLNLNIPEDTRKVLRRLARQAHRREAELARELLVRAVAAAERDALLQRVAAAQTPELQRRQLELARALGRLRG